MTISALPGIRALIMGPGGTGKTTSLATLVEAGLEVFVIFTESGRESLLGYWTDRGLPVPENLHWKDIRAANLGFADLAAAAQDVLTLSPKMLFDKPDANKPKYTAFIQTLTTLSKFVCDRDNKDYGAVDKWGTNRVIAIDSLTGISDFAMQNVTGGKVVRDQADWGKAQGLLTFLLRQLADGCRAHFMLLAHVERETDTVSGGIKLMPSTLGKALPPKLSPMFSEVLLAERIADRFVWTNNSPMADTKSRYLPPGQHPQDFRPLIKQWQSRGGVIGA